jgi:nucleoside-diphosphate-sugar epimerase
MKKILVTGSCGYVGSKLVTQLLLDGYVVDVIDNQWFGNYLKKHQNLKVYKTDIRDVGNIDFSGVDSIIHLANIANDPGVELNQSLSWEVNVLSSQIIIEKAIECRVKNFIYASSGSVYGIKEEENVTEELSLVPISTYNKTKMVAERVLMSYKNDIDVHCIRPATVCGWSPRMRFDISVNILTLQAFKNNHMTVFGGEQTRPNIHINDMVRVYQFFLQNNLPSGFYNAGFENLKIIEIAHIIKKHIPDVKISISDSNDPRSYRQNSDKLLNFGFTPNFRVENAIEDLIKRLSEGSLKEDKSSHTVKWMKHLNLDEN